MYFRHLVLAACLLLLSGCGIIDYFFLPPPEDTAQELYEGANDAMQEKNYSQAAQYYTKLKDNFPFSPYTVEAELSLGDAFFLDGSHERRYHTTVKEIVRTSSQLLAKETTYLL